MSCGFAEYVFISFLLACAFCGKGRILLQIRRLCQTLAGRAKVAFGRARAPVKKTLAPPGIVLAGCD
jgi:hypothetical protein